MTNFRICMLLVSLLVVDAVGERRTDYDEPEQGGRSFFFLGGLFRRIRSRWQNPNLPPSPYGGGPIFAGYYGCGYYNCRPPVTQYQVVQPMQAIQHVQAVQPVVVQQAGVYQPNAPVQAVAVAQVNPAPVYPVPAPPLPPPPPPPPPPQPTQVQYPTQVAYGSPQPYQPYPVYPAYAPTVPGQIYQNAGCAYPGYICGRKS